MQNGRIRIRTTIHLDRSYIAYALFLMAQIGRSSAYLNHTVRLNLILKLLQACCLLFCLGKRIVRRRFSMLDLAILGFYTSLLVSTMMVSKDYASWAMYALQGIGSVFLIEDMFREDEKKSIAIIRNLSFAFILCNCVSMLWFPDGIYDGYYFLGSRIGFTPFCIFAAMAALFYDYIWKKKKISGFSCLILLMAIWNLARQRVSTGIFGILMLVILLIIGNCINKNGFRRMNYKIAVLLPLVAWALIVLGGRSGGLQTLLALMKEDTTFGGRTVIWEMALYYISQKPFWGYGVTVLGDFYISTYINKRNLPAHDELLNLLYQGGIAAFVCWLALFIVIGRALEKCKDRYLVAMMSALIFSFSCVMITEIQSQKTIIFLVIALAYQTGRNHSGGLECYV